MSDFKAPKQLLSKEKYYDPEWFEQEQQKLFNQSWIFACVEEQLAQIGDYHCLQFMNHPLVVVRGKDGNLQAFHNICRHRGCEVLEGSGNTGGAIVCPYHRWSYELNGNLRGVPNEEECFGVIARDSMSLNPASVGVYRGVVFVNPEPNPREGFSDWIANLDDFAWPHNITDDNLEFKGKLTYEMQCNWKVFYENAIDGYHLGYLHDKTLGKLYPDRQVWKTAGRNVVWYSTEREGEPQSNPLLTESYRGQRMAGHEKANYPGVVMLFPLTIVSPSPWGLSISILEPVGPELTNLHGLNWAPKESAGARPRPEAAVEEGVIRLGDIDTHPLESGSFQLEDMWICEKIQRTLHSPNFKIGPLANGAGAEAPLTHFQQSVIDYVDA